MDTTTRDFMVAHLRLHGWEPYITSYIEIFNRQRVIFIGAHMVRGRYITPGPCTFVKPDEVRAKGDWGDIPDEALECLFNRVVQYGHA